MKKQKCIVQFVWPGDDEGDYLCYREMSAAEITETAALLERAVEAGRIRPEPYVGPLGESNDPHAHFIEELRKDLFPDDEGEG